MITVNNTVAAPIQDIEILGKTIQSETDLSDIRSVGDLQPDGKYKLSILSANKNLFDGKLEVGGLNSSTGDLVVVSDRVRSTNFVKVPNTFTLSRDVVTDVLYLYEYTKDFKYNLSSPKSMGVNEKTKTFTVNSGTCYIKVADKSNNANAKFQVQEGTVATQYSPHISNKSSILLPVQLEKVGDVADRLYFDDVEKAWCVEKNVVTRYLDRLPVGVAFSMLENTVRFNALKSNVFDDAMGINPGNNLGVCDRLLVKHMWDKDEEGFYIDTNFCMRLSKSKFSELSPVAYEKYLKDNPIMFKYVTTQPTKIILPKSIQIQLNSHLNKTHIYTTDTEIEPTIKAKVSKSMGATVQANTNEINILKDRVGDIEGLKKSQNVDYSTHKGYLVCEHTQDGVVKDMVVKGRTLVNLGTRKGGTITGNASNISLVDNPIRIKTNNEITISFDVDNKTNNSIKIALGCTGITIYPSGVGVPSGFKGRHTIKATPVKDGATHQIQTVRLYVDKGVEGVAPLDNIVILEGDHTQNPPSYFEGMLSVGEDVDKIEVSSVKSDGNLINPNTFKFKVAINGEGVDTVDNSWCSSDFIKVNNGDVLQIIRGNGVLDSGSLEGYVYLYYYDSNMNYIKIRPDLGQNMSTYTVNNLDVKYIRLAIKYSKVENIALFKSNVPKPYEMYQGDKKAILYKDPTTQEWLPTGKNMPLHEWDEVNETKGKLYKRSEKVVLNGSEDFWQSAEKPNSILFTMEINTNGSLSASTINCICDKFNGSTGDNTWNIDAEGISVASASRPLRIRISKSKLETPDVAGFKKWLQANNVTVVYQLAQEEVFDIAPLSVDAYANETMISVASGALSPYMEFSITSYITNLIQSNKERIKGLEAEVYKYMVTQNRLQLASTYSADSVTFKVDFANGLKSVTDGDPDLYKLIENNILVGKDNYNYDRMFTIIMDYTSWEQITWDQFDVLVALMDYQHNPPVEELPEELPSEEGTVAPSKKLKVRTKKTPKK